MIYVYESEQQSIKYFRLRAEKRESYLKMLSDCLQSKTIKYEDGGQWGPVEAVDPDILKQTHSE